MKGVLLKRTAPVLAALAVLLAAACSGDGADETPPTPIPTATTAPASPTPDPLGEPEADGDRIIEHVRELSEEPRVAGTDGEIRARDYIQSTLESYGYDVEIQPFAFDSTRYLPARIELDGVSYAALSLRGAPPGDVTGRVVQAGLGRPADFPPMGAQGAVAFVDRGEITFAEKVANAAAAGASAIIIVNNEDGRLVADAPGATIPAIGVTTEDGDAMRAQLTANSQATVESQPPTGTAYNVIARPPGIDVCTTVTGGHADSVPVSPGADDNASGSAGVLEVARLAMANKLAGANCFVLFGAEEIGLYGSLHYVEQLSDEELNALTAMLNLDVIGTPVDLVLIGSDDMVEVARVEADALGIEATRGNVPSGLGSDHASFEEAGVPVVFFYRHDDMIHTRFDAIDRIDAETLEDTVTLAYATLERIAGAG